MNWTWRCMPVIPAFGRLRQEYLELGYMGRLCLKKLYIVGHWLLTPAIPATQEAEIRRILVLSQPVQIVFETLPQK
jgi:hypothetical protein